MAFKVYRGKTKTEYFPVTVSTAFTKNTLVEWTSNKIAPADDNDTDLAGVIVKEITSSDDDYADTRQVPVRVPVEKHVVWEADASGFTVGSDEGGEFGISDAGTVDQTDTTNKVFKVTEVLSATKVRGYLKINGGTY